MDHLTWRLTQGASIVKGPLTQQQLNLASPQPIYIIIKEQPHQAALKGTIELGVQEKRKDRKLRKSRSEEKAKGFSSDTFT